MQNVSEYMLLLALCLVNIAIEKAYCNNMDQKCIAIPHAIRKKKSVAILIAVLNKKASIR